MAITLRIEALGARRAAARCSATSRSDIRSGRRSPRCSGRDGAGKVDTLVDSTVAGGAASRHRGQVLLGDQDPHQAAAESASAGPGIAVVPGAAASLPELTVAGQPPASPPTRSLPTHADAGIEPTHRSCSPS